MLSGVDVAVVQAALWHGSGEGHLDHVEWGDPEDPELRAAAVALGATGRTYTFLSRPVSRVLRPSRSSFQTTTVSPSHT